MTVLLALFLLYLLPGFAAAAIFTDRTRYNPLLWLLISLIAVPLLLANLGTLGMPTTSAGLLAVELVALSGGLFALASFARNRGFGIELEPAPRSAGDALPRSIAIAVLALFWVLVAAARLELRNGHVAAVSDDLQRLSHVTAIAVTGVPPRHYYLPELPLSYYYLGAVLSGLSVRLAEGSLTAGAAVFNHVALQTLAVCAAIFAAAFRLCRKPWSALFLVLMLTFAGGLDFWAIAANRALTSPHVEHWNVIQFATPTFMQYFYQLSVPTTLAVWVPHHWIAGLSVLLVPLLVRHVRGRLETRAALMAVLFAFIAGASVFVALGLAPGIALWTILAWRQRWPEWSFRVSMIALLAAGALSLHLLPIYLGKTSMIGWYPPFGVAKDASVSTLIGAKVAQLHLFVGTVALETGICSLLFYVWVVLAWRSLWGSAESAWIAAIGLTFMPLTYLFRSPIYDDFGMRGMVASQYAWPVGAAWALTAASSGVAHRAIVTVAVLGGLAGIPSTLFGAYRDIQKDQRSEPLPAPIAWVNANAPLGAPVLFAQPLIQMRELNGYQIERMRPLNLFFVRRLVNLDGQYLQERRLAELDPPFFDVTSEAGVCRTAARLGSDLVYVLDVASGASGRRFRQKVIGDETGTLYQVDCASLPPEKTGDRG